MWKLVKLIVLATLTVVVGIISYPTWREILASPVNDGWNGDKDSIVVVADRDEVASARFSLTGRMRSSTETGRGAAETSTDASLDLALKPGVKSTTLYFVGYGKAAAVLDSCIDGAAKGNEFVGLERLTAKEAGLEKLFRADPRNDADWGDSTGATFYKMQTSGSPGIDSATGYDTAAPCHLDNTHFWIKRGSRYVFSGPLIEVDVVRDLTTVPDEVLPVSRPADEPGGVCTQVALTWRAGISPGTPNPAPARTYSPSDSDADAHDFDNGFEWLNCQTVGDQYDENGYGVIEPAPSVDLNDNLNADVVTRNLFFAGAVLGLLGSIVVEIIGAFLDVAEWLVRVVRKRAEANNEIGNCESRNNQNEGEDQDQDQDMSPEDSYDPGPRGYL